ncbi:hypothetical protein F908_00493 [Acinetobacter sp. NIPH 284]|nr:hypothetical protein [Acinetobacter sp. NIPH 284]ENW84446.1 hypothetical protein F908_00493 [Acinetobacter sp. NIPH 284]
MKLIAKLILIIGFIVMVGPSFVLMLLAIMFLMALAGWDNKSDDQ